MTEAVNGDAHAFVCTRCGQGFLTAQPHSIHQYPVFAVLSDPDNAGPRCMGTVRYLTKAAALRLAANLEQGYVSPVIPV